MVIVAAAEQAVSSADGGSTLLTIGVVVIGGYLLSLLLHPNTACGACKGTPRSYGSVYTKAFRLCSSCGGRGRERRLGARLLGIGSD